MLIPFNFLFAKYNVNATGILHIGASTGQEMESYYEMGISDVVFVEAIPEVYRDLQRKMVNYPDTICINACITDKDGDIIPFHISNNEKQSSSIFEFGTHSQAHPGVVFTDHTRLQTITVKSLLKDRNLKASKYNFINIDIQGAELLALKGMDLTGVDYAYLEVNEKELYRGCALMPEIDDYLAGEGLHRVELTMTAFGWGDAFYIRKGKLPGGMVAVPKHFQPEVKSKYPKDNHTDFETYYLQSYQPFEGRTYLPILWTSFYCQHKYGKDEGAIAGLQNFLKGLDRNQKYYTVVQYDDGILNNLDHLDIKVFSMSGKPMDYPLPLLCQPHPDAGQQYRTIYANFVGRVTHRIREQLVPFAANRGWLVQTNHMPMHAFCDTLAKSIFTLCPRGYGPTSFRIMEAMQQGSIPVYISDEHIIPHNLDFNSYGVLVGEHQIKDLKEILAGVDIKGKQAMVKQVYQDYYTYESNKRIIENNCSI